MTSVTSSGNPSNSPLVDQAYADGQTAYDMVAKGNQDSVTAGNALFSLFAQYPDFPGNIDINDDSALTQWFAANHPEASGQLADALQQRSTARQEQLDGVDLEKKAKASAIAAGFDVSNIPITEVSPIVSQTLDELNNVTIGDDVLQTAQEAGSALAVDMNGMDLTDMLMMVFAASNKAKEGLQKDQVSQLNDQNQEVGKLTDLMSQVRDQVPANPDDTTSETVDSSVLDALKAGGVELPPSTTGADGTTATMKASDLSKLVDNIKGKIDTMNDMTQLAIQGITKTNNDIDENYQVMSTTQTDVHQSKMGLAAGR